MFFNLIKILCPKYYYTQNKRTQPCKRKQFTLLESQENIPFVPWKGQHKISQQKHVGSSKNHKYFT